MNKYGRLIPASISRLRKRLIKKGAHQKKVYRQKRIDKVLDIWYGTATRPRDIYSRY